MDSRIIDAKLKTIGQRYCVQSWPIDTWEARLATHLAPGQYQFEGDWQATSGESRWPAGKTLFLRQKVATPDGVDPADLYLKADFEGLEGLVSIDGAAYSGIDANHTLVAIPQRGELELGFEFMALGASLYRPELRQEKARLKTIAFVQVDRPARDAYYDLWFAWEASRSARDERRRRLLHAALEEALLLVDLTAPPAEYRDLLLRAQHQLRYRVSQIAPDPEAGRFMLTGHSHIDTAWLWPLRETIRKTGRTFSTACRLLERYPDYHFTCSQPQLYAYAKQYFPELYAEVKKWVAAGRWECTGGMWVEADCNIPSGEALIRQVLYGTAFFQDEFGVTPRSLWLPDVFGYPASLPGILAGCGISYFYTNKLHWQARNPFPTNLFWWEGLDGQRVLAHIPKHPDYYNGWPNPEQLSTAWENYHEKAEYPEVLFPFGFGDGGGGPTEEMLEFASRSLAYPGLPAARQGLEEEYFDQVRAAAPDLPTWSGELYLETHRGTYTTHAEIKKANRRSELLLRDAEIFGALASFLGKPVNLKRLKPAWLNLVLLQFHDILPGSSIGEVYQEAAVDHAQIQATAAEVCGDALTQMSQPSEEQDLLAFNSLSWARSDALVVEVPGIKAAPGDALEAVQADGSVLAVQVLASSAEGAQITFQPQALPALGCQGYHLRPATQPAEHSLQVEGRRLQNRFFTLELDEQGALTRLYDHHAGREILPAGAAANQLQLFQDGPEREAAWNVHNTLDKRAYDWDGPAVIRVGKSGPVCASLVVVKRFRSSRLVQEIVLYDQTPRIDFVTQVEWQERQVLLKASFPLEVRSPEASYEVQYGVVRRATHRNTSWEQEKFEVCGHRWADLSETGYGVSLLNDSKYGYDARGNTLRLTLLRGTESPDPDADRGTHEFTYSLYPHSGDAAAAETARHAWELNAPIVCLAGALPGEGLSLGQSFFEVSGPAILDTLKPAEDGRGWILRFYEPYGSRGPVSVSSAIPLEQVTRCDHLERDAATLHCKGNSFEFPIRPFEVKTLRILPVS